MEHVTTSLLGHNIHVCSQDLFRLSPIKNASFLGPNPESLRQSPPVIKHGVLENPPFISIYRCFPAINLHLSSFIGDFSRFSSAEDPSGPETPWPGRGGTMMRWPREVSPPQASLTACRAESPGFPQDWRIGPRRLATTRCQSAHIRTAQT